MTKRLEDSYAIRELSSRYALLIDTRNFDELEKLFSANAVYGRGDELMGEGRENVMAFIRAHFAANPLATFHYSNDVVIDFDPDNLDRAHGVVSGHAETRPDGQLQLLAVRYADEYVREGGRWLLAKRWLHFPLR